MATIPIFFFTGTKEIKAVGMRMPIFRRIWACYGGRTAGGCIRPYGFLVRFVLAFLLGVSALIGEPINAFCRFFDRGNPSGAARHLP